MTPIRTLHHLSCTGGTLITKCLAAMPNVMVLNEVDPLSTMAQVEGQPAFTPTDIISLVRQGDPSVSDTLLARLFLQSLAHLQSELQETGKQLLLRDHSHSHFLTRDRIPDRPTVRAIVSSRFPTASIVTIRDPVDSFLSLRQLAFGWNPIIPATFDEYCRRYLAFLDAYEGVPVFKYEDFVRAPLPVMKRMCEVLDLAFSEDFIDTFSGFQFSGDSGRKGDAITPRERREADAELIQAAARSGHYQTLIRRLGYPAFSSPAPPPPMKPTNKPKPTKRDVLQRIKEFQIPAHEIVDVGVRERTWELLSEFPGARHHLFEPANIFFGDIHNNYSGVEYILYPLALGSENREMHFVVSSLHNDGVATHGRISEEPVEVDGKTIVGCSPLQVRRFEDMDVDVAKDFLLKVDVDGSDLEVLKGFGGKISWASVIIVEVTFMTIVERIDFISKSGFELFDIVDLVYYGAGIYQFDAVFVRKDLINNKVRPSIMEFDSRLWHAI
ncbi:MAG: FkbM family methyltransferase [Candidatus Methylumidiphilus sp.]